MPWRAPKAVSTKQSSSIRVSSRRSCCWPSSRSGKAIPAAAVDLLVPLIKERPQIAQAQYLLATAYLAQQKRDEALAVYRQMTELFPKDPQPPFLVGSILLGTRSAGGRAQGVREISRDFSGLSAGR